MKVAQAVALLIASSLVSGAVADADIYSWRDSSGVDHYTNDRERIPPDARDGAATVAKDWDRGAPPPEAPPEATGEKEAPAEPGHGDEAPGELQNVGLEAIAGRGFEAGYAAGIDAAEAQIGSGVRLAPFGAAADPNLSIGPIVQHVEVRVESPAVRERVFGFFSRGFRHGQIGSGVRLAPFGAAADPNLSGAGPAGPPPLGAPGPPPFAAVR